MKRISRPRLSHSSLASVATVSLLTAALLISPHSVRAAATQAHAVGWGGTSLWIGYSGTVGYVTIDGGTQRAVETGTVSLGYAAGDTATINVTGRDGNGTASQWTIRTLSGGPGKAFINVTDYGILNAYSLGIASSSTGAVAGGIKVNTNGILNTTTGLSFGTGTGNVDVAIASGGTLNTAGISMGTQTATAGKVVNFTLDGEGTAANVSGFLQTYGTSNITVSNGAVATFTTSFNYLSNNATGTTAVVIKDAGSLMSFTTALNIGSAGTATLTVADGGKLRVGTYDVNNVFTGGEIKLGVMAGTSLQVGTGGAAGHIDAAKITGGYSASNRATVVFNHNETAYTFNNDAGQNILLSGYLDVNVVAGTTVFNSGHTYFGTTTISGGKLILDNPTDYLNPGSGNSNIVIGSEGTLQIGTGGNTGNTAGTATIANNGLLVINRSDAHDMSQTITGAGNIVYEGSGTITRWGGGASTGSIALDGGTLIAQSSQALGASGSIYFNGGTLSIGSGIGATDLSTRFSTNANQQFRLGVASGLNHTMSGNISSTGGTMTKLGTGTLILNGTNTFTGATTIREGTLKAGNSAALSRTSSIIVNSGATFDVASSDGGFAIASGQTLGGSGTVKGFLTMKSGSHLTPGDSVGTLTFTFGLDLEANVNLNFELGTVSDKIVVSGNTLRGNGPVTVNITDSGGFGEGTYTLIDASGVTALSSIGATQFELGTAVGGYTYYFTQVGQTFVLNVTAVPEPATYAAILGVAVLGVAGLVNRRRRRAARVATS